MSFVREAPAECLVHGWIRENYEYYKMPTDLIRVCLSMYFCIIDTWNQTKSNLVYQFSKHGMVRVNKPDTLMGGNISWNAFGELIVSKGDIMEWRFKIHTNSLRRNKPAIMIGIAEENDSVYDSDKCFANHGNLDGGRAYNTLTGDLWSANFSGKEYNISDDIDDDNIVIMTLDMTGNKGLLWYETGTLDLYDGLDCIYHGVAFDDIDIEKSYIMAVAVWSNCESIQIIE